MVGLYDVTAWLLALLRPKKTPPVAQVSTIRRSASAYAQRALESEVGRLSMAGEGQRNDQLNRSAFALGQLVAAGALDALEVARALGATAERIGLEPDEIEKTLRSGLDRGMTERRQLPA